MAITRNMSSSPASAHNTASSRTCMHSSYHSWRILPRARRAILSLRAGCGDEGARTLGFPAVQRCSWG
ncbi:unnamed protein product [Ectocarpus sp. CCAP 1310/34]|nr:unnamed protein product [Ectocarpus sp. CCAP 1310/34]